MGTQSFQSDPKPQNSPETLCNIFMEGPPLNQGPHCLIATVSYLLCFLLHAVYPYLKKPLGHYGEWCSPICTAHI